MVDQNQIKKIIEDGDPVVLIKQAKDVAARLSGGEATRTQTRKLFGRIRQIEMNWPRDPQDERYPQELNDAYRDLVLFEPFLAYQTQRHQQIRPLTDVIQQAIPLVGKDRSRLLHLVQFFEAIVAYQVAGGGGDPQGSRPSSRPQNYRR